MADNLFTKFDEEWVVLIREAKALGLSVEEVRMFLQEKSQTKGGWEGEKRTADRERIL